MKVFPPFGATNFPFINSPYWLLISTRAADSGAGAYSNLSITYSLSLIQRHVVRASVIPIAHFHALHEQIV